MSDITVSGVSFISIGIYFVAYIVLHVIIAFQEKKYRELLRLPEKVKEAKQVIKEQGATFNQDDLGSYKFFSFLNLWFPAMYLIIILIIMYGF